MERSAETDSFLRVNIFVMVFSPFIISDLTLPIHVQNWQMDHRLSCLLQPDHYHHSSNSYRSNTTRKLLLFQAPHTYWLTRCRLRINRRLPNQSCLQLNRSL